MFGASFQSTLGRSQREQALYRAGGDLEVQVLAPTGNTVRDLASVPYIHSFTPVARESATLLDVFPGSSVTVLAVDPVPLVDVAWYREDFSPSGKTLSELVTPLRRGQSRLPDLSGNLASGILIPENAESIGLWVNSQTFADSAVQQSLNMWLRISDSRGNYENLDLGAVEVSRGAPPQEPGSGPPQAGWAWFQAPMPQEKYWLDPPFSVVAIYFVGRSLYRMPPGSIYLDDITVKLKPPAPGTGAGAPGAGPGEVPAAAGQSLPRTGFGDGGEEQVIEDFEDIGLWVALPNSGDAPDSALITRRAARPDANNNQGRGLEFTWQDPLLQHPRGILIPPGDFPLPALGSPDLANGHSLRINLGTQLLPVLVQDSLSYFPTIPHAGVGRSRNFLLVSLHSFQDYTARLPRGTQDPPREYWLKLEQGADRAEAVRLVRDATSVSANIRDRSALLDQYQRDPLSGGGWNGLTLLALAALTIVVTLALATHAVVAVREARVELTVTRALGFSRVQLVSLLVLERLLVAAVGLAAGAFIGYYLGRWTLGYLGLSPGGLPIVPPMVLTVQAWLIALVIVNLAIAAALATIVAAVSVARLRPSDILRNRG